MSKNTQPTFLAKCENTIKILRSTPTKDLAICRDAYGKGNEAGRLIALFADIELDRR